jgi:hypothetical protein
LEEEEEEFAVHGAKDQILLQWEEWTVHKSRRIYQPLLLLGVEQKISLTGVFMFTFTFFRREGRYGTIVNERTHKKWGDGCANVRSSYQLCAPPEIDLKLKRS